MMMLYWLEHTLLFYTLVFIFGLCVGSFLNVLTYRLPQMLKREWTIQCHEFLETTSPDQEHPSFNLFIPRSHCPKCHNPIPWWQNIPLISYIILGAKCANCRQKISFRYPLIELLTAVLSLMVALYAGFSLVTFWLLVLTWGLIALSTIDLDHQLLPDSLVLSLLWLGLLLSLTHHFTTPTSAIIGASVGYLCIWSVAKFYKLITRQDGMGHGDCKLFALFGAWFGWQVLPFILIFAAFSGSIIGLLLIALRKHHRRTPIPFGPFLATAGWIAALWGEQINSSYLMYLNLN